MTNENNLKNKIKERDCPNCKHHTDNGCSSWDCEFEPTTTNNIEDDCISRAQVQTEIEMNASRYTIAKERGGMGQVEWSDQLIKVSDAVDIIRNLPSVIPQEPKTGHWISHREHCENLGVMPSGLGAYEWCSNCDCGIDVREWHRNYYNYCPKCGADMRGEEE